MEDIDILELIEEGDEMRKFSDQYEYLSLLGKGAFGVVVKARNLTTDQIVAIKVIKKRTILHNDSQDFQSEASILSQLRHQNVVKFIDFKQTDLRILIVMEYIDGGSLQDLINRKLSENQWFDEEQCKVILRSILEALSYMHDKNLLHRDLKPENILVKEDLSCVKLSDFGLSDGYNTQMKKQCGTLTYMAPELLNNKVYNKSVDLWSVGVIMYNLLFHGEHPYYHSGYTLEKLQENITSFHSSAQSKMTQLQYSLFKKLTDLDSSKRYSCNQSLFHPWLNENTSQIPQTMEEMFITWQCTQQFSSILKALVVLQKMGYQKINTEKEACEKIGQQKENELREQYKKQGKVIHINKEFYDQLFEDYQKTLTDTQKQQVQQNINTLAKKSSIINEGLPKLSVSPTPQENQSPQSSISKFIIKTKKSINQSVNMIQEEELSGENINFKNQSLIDIPQYESSNLENEKQGNTSKTENLVLPSPTKTSPLRKKKKRPPVKLYIQRTDSLNQSQDEQNCKLETNTNTNSTQVKIENKAISSSYHNSPSRLPQPVPPVSKFKIQLQPIQQPIQPLIQQNLPNIRDGRPRNQSIHFQQRCSRLSVDRDKVTPNILDLSSMALGGVSPVHSNQFLFPQRNNSISQPQQIKRMYPNEFHPSKILSNGKNKADFLYNFINGGPK